MVRHNVDQIVQQNVDQIELNPKRLRLDGERFNYVSEKFLQKKVRHQLAERAECTNNAH